MDSEAEWIARLPKLWEVVAPDATKRNHYIIRCLVCGAEGSRSKYHFKNANTCWDCWLFDQVNRHPRVKQRLLGTSNEVDELERLNSLPDPRD